MEILNIYGYLWRGEYEKYLFQQMVYGNILLLDK